MVSPPLRAIVAAAFLFLLAGCGADFEAGAYENGGVVYRFDDVGGGTMAGVLPGAPIPFTYDTSGDEVAIQFDGGQPMAFKILGDGVIERPDGKRLTRRAD